MFTLLPPIGFGLASERCENAYKKVLLEDRFTRSRACSSSRARERLSEIDSFLKMVLAETETETPTSIVEGLTIKRVVHKTYTIFEGGGASISYVGDYVRV